MGLHELKTGNRARVHSIAPGNKNSSRLYELGLVPGEEVEVIRKAPLGGPMVIRVMGYELCLRRDCASSIRIGQVQTARAGS